VVSIMPQDPDSKASSPNSLKGVAEMMLGSADPFTVEVGHLIDFIGATHEPPVTCEDCRDHARDSTYPCLMQDTATSVVIAWLRKVLEERG
jgi:hypothetical protein